jgi:DNA-binding CsgD family transcriptional regulator
MKVDLIEYPLSTNPKLLEMLKHETKKLGVNFLRHFGFREFYPDGTTVGTSTNEDWNNKILDLTFKTEMEHHYFEELKQVTHNQVTYIIRTKDHVTNNFQRKLLAVNMSNSLVIYKKTDKSIRGYYFICDPQDYQSQIFFINNLMLFNKITNIVTNTLDLSDLLLEELITKKFQLFSKEEITKIFCNKKADRVNNINLISNGKRYFFTPKEVEVLEVVRYGCTIKEVANSLNISPRTAEWHLQKIKQKLGTSSKLALIAFAQNVINA